MDLRGISAGMIKLLATGRRFYFWKETQDNQIKVIAIDALSVKPEQITKLLSSCTGFVRLSKDKKTIQYSTPIEELVKEEVCKQADIEDTDNIIMKKFSEDELKRILEELEKEEREEIEKTAKDLKTKTGEIADIILATPSAKLTKAAAFVLLVVQTLANPTKEQVLAWILAEVRAIEKKRRKEQSKQQKAKKIENKEEKAKVKKRFDAKKAEEEKKITKQQKELSPKKPTERQLGAKHRKDLETNR